MDGVSEQGQQPLHLLLLQQQGGVGGEQHHAVQAGNFSTEFSTNSDLFLHYRVQFPPRNIKISPAIQTVKENWKPRDFLCSAEVVEGLSEINKNYDLIPGFPPR